MAYEPTNWKDGDLVTAKKLNKLEHGVANAGTGSGGGMVVNISEEASKGMVLDHTWKEIFDAIQIMPVTILVVEDGVYMQGNILSVAETEDAGRPVYSVAAAIWMNGGYDDRNFTTDSEDGYPSIALPTHP